MATLGHISLDGSKFKANSSKYKAMSYKLKEKEQELMTQIGTLIKQTSQCNVAIDGSCDPYPDFQSVILTHSFSWWL